MTVNVVKVGIKLISIFNQTKIGKLKLIQRIEGIILNLIFNRGSEQNPDLLHIRIPQIELARVLFFHNAYLARNCIDQGILAREFLLIL